MRSPFPGMDPYLENHWEDVHTRLIGYVCDALQPQLSEDLVARMEEKVYVEDDTETRLRRPDVRVVEFPTTWTPSAGDASTAVLDEPVLLERTDPDDVIPDRSVLIYDAVGNRIVTAIEILSPWNKAPGKAVETYLQKREKYVNSKTNLVEIDLIRVGDWTKMIGPYRVKKNDRTTYRATLSQPELRGPLHYPISLRAKLPAIRIPLREQDQPAKLNLQELIDKAYQMGRYNHIDYNTPCSPPLSEQEAQWAKTLIDAARS